MVKNNLKRISFIGASVITAFLALICAGQVKAQLLLPLESHLVAPPLLRQIEGNIYAVWPERYTDTMDVYRLSRYDGRTWTHMPQLCIQKGGTITDLALFSGKIYVSGNFRLFFDPQYNCLTVLDNRMWTGVASFTALFTQVPTIQTMAVFNNNLYAGGRFSRMNGTLVNNLVVNTGTEWSALGTSVPGADGAIVQMATRGSDLAICGSFRKINGATAPGLAFYTGAQFTTRYTPVKSGRKLYAVAGNYWYSGLDSNGRMILTSMNGLSALNLSMKGLDSIGVVDGFCESSGKIYAVGRFFKTGSKMVINTIMLEDQVWVAHPILTPNQFVQIAASRNELYFSGTLNKVLGKNMGYGLVKLLPDKVQVSGYVYHDINNNGTREAGERALANRKVNISGLGSLFTDGSGYYEFRTITGNKVRLTLEPQSGWKTAQEVQLNLTDSPWVYQIDFPQVTEESNYRDVRVDITSGDGWKVNRDATSAYVIKVENTGQVSSSVRLELEYNKKLSDLQVVPAPDIINTGKFTWNIALLAPGESFLVNMVSWISSQQFEIGEALGFKAIVTPNGLTPDENPDDNIDTLPQIVADRPAVSVEKLQFPMVKPGDTIAYLPNNENVLQYVIRFENQGLDTVSQVQVTDTVDISLNLSYIRESGSSHPFSRKMILDPALPGKAILVYTFNNINLPPNADANPEYTLSKGFFGLHIGLKGGNPAGTVIHNRAGVTFDLAPGVLSNTVSCMLTSTGGGSWATTSPGPISNLQLFPNPTEDMVLVQGKAAIASLMIYDVWGRTVGLSAKTEGARAMLSLKALAPGRYLITAIGKDGSVAKGQLLKL
ncbi:MAG: hypothetical protein RLZZ370_1224 [Bacteroidota bacterium]